VRRLVGLTGLLLTVAVLAYGLARLGGGSANAAMPFVPDDTGRAGVRAGWAQLQWNFVGAYGVGASDAWGNLRAAGAEGGAGVTVAVLDTGVAYPTGDAARPGSPDLNPDQFVPGYDFVDGDEIPYDQNGHGTHVASTIAEQTDNATGLTGLAYGVKLMPVRVLDREGQGDARRIALGIRFAVDHGAKIINLSLNFDDHVEAGRLADLLDALEYAHEQSTLVVAGAGNTGASTATYPALGPHVMAVGATTDDGCLASYSNYGAGVDLVAPGGGADANVVTDPACRVGRHGQSIYQVTLAGPQLDHFETVGYIGTSMATPHVSATAALVLASGVLGAASSPDDIEARLEQTSRDLGTPGFDNVYGWGLVNAAAATAPGPVQRPS
jgi:serine protease